MIADRRQPQIFGNQFLIRSNDRVFGRFFPRRGNRSEHCNHSQEDRE
jgi:hypothetical protein